MAVTASLKFTQSSSTPGAGLASTGTVGASVLCENASNTNVVHWTFALLDVPIGSALSAGTLITGTTDHANFTPDVLGSYRVQLTVTDNLGVSATDVRTFAVGTSRGWILPAFLNTHQDTNYSAQTRGWMFLLNTIFKDIANYAFFLNTGYSATSGQILVWSGTAWAPADPPSAGVTSIRDLATGSTSGIVTVGSGKNTSARVTSTPQLLIDFVVASQANGDLMYFDSTSGTWIRLPAGTGSKVLNIDSVSGLPAWQKIVAANVSNTANIEISKIAPGSPDTVFFTQSGGSNVSGKLTDAQVSSVAAISTTKLAAGTVGQLLVNNATPTPVWLAPTGGDGTAVTSSGTVFSYALSVTSQANGDMICRVSGAWARIPGGTSGYVLTSNGSGVAPTWQAAPSGVPTGTAGQVLVENGSAVPTFLTPSSGVATAVTSDGTTLKWDLSIALQAQGDLIYRNATTWTRLGAGTANQLLSTGGASANPAWGFLVDANIDAAAAMAVSKLGATTGNNGQFLGVSAGVPTWQALPASVTSLAGSGRVSVSASTGAVTVSLANLVNADISASAAIAVTKIAAGTAGQFLWNNGTPAPAWASVSNGDGTVFTSDGTTFKVDLTVTSQATGDMLWRSATGWARVAAGSSGQYLKSQGSTTIPVWTTFSIADADVSSSAAIAVAKFGATTGNNGQFLGVTAGVATWQALPASVTAIAGSGRVSVSASTGSVTVSLANLVNADISASAAIAVSKMAAGTAGQLLTNNATPTPIWLSPTSGDGTAVTADGTTLAWALSVASQANGDMLVRVSGAWTRIPGDTSGKVLTSTGATAAPTWQTPATSSTPTGTGFTHITAGAQDSAAKLVADADVSSSAAIAVTKVAAGTAGQILWNNTTPTPTWKSFAAGDGTAWTADGTTLKVDISVTSQAAGDLLIRTATPAWGRLAIGSSSAVLTSSGSSPQWTSGLTNSHLSATANIVPTKLSTGSSGQVVGANGSGNTWLTTAGSDGVGLTLSGTTLTWALSVTSQANGDILQRISGAWVRVPGGSSGQVLTYQSGTSVATWTNVSGTTPTGTGFTHVTAGVQDGASKLVADADVDSAAAIAITKLAAASYAGLSLGNQGAGPTPTYGPPGCVATTTVSVGLSAGNTDTTLYTTPALSGAKILLTYVYMQVTTAIVGSGTCTVTVGATAGGTEYMKSIALTSANGQRVQVFGKSVTAEMGTSFISAAGQDASYMVDMAGAATVIARMATTGTFSSGALTFYTGAWVLVLCALAEALRRTRSQVRSSVSTRAFPPIRSARAPKSRASAT